MKLVQFNIVLPLSPEELLIAEEVATLMIEMHIFKNTSEKINYILTKDYNSTEYVLGFS